MDSGNKHDDEVDIFELADAQSKPVPPVEHIETETNVFFVETLRQAAAAAQHGGGGVDTGAFEVSAPAQAAVDDAPFEDDNAQKKGGFFAKLFGRGARGNDKEEEDSDDRSDDLSLDDDMFIAPPPASERASGGGTAAPTPQPSVDEPTIVATVPEVTDSGVFEFKLPASEAAPETTDEVVIVATVPEVTESGIFELGPSASEAASETTDEPEPEPTTVATVPEVTDSGVFELGPSASDEPEPTTVATVPEVTDSGVFELGPPPDAPAHTHDASKGGDEWEIGWEPEGEEAVADFDVSGDAHTAAAAAPAADAEAAPDVPPPVFTKLAHVCLYVQDLGRSVEYYSKIGFRKRFVFNRNGRLFGAYLEFGEGNFIELFEDISRSAVTAPGRLAHFCLETPDIDAAMESLSARGIDFSPKKLGCDSTYQIWLKDPDGNEFEIHQYTANSSQLIGGEVEADW